MLEPYGAALSCSSSLAVLQESDDEAPAAKAAAAAPAAKAAAAKVLPCFLACLMRH